MKPQKTYHGKTAGQWLAQSEICESRAGLNEIFIGKGVIARHHPEGMMLETAGGPLAVLKLGPLQNEAFCNLMELRDASA